MQILPGALGEIILFILLLLIVTIKFWCNLKKILDRKLNGYLNKYLRK